MKTLFSVALVFLIGCARTAPYPNDVRGFLVDGELDVFSLPEENYTSIRPFVEQVLARNSLHKGIRYAIAPNGVYVACLDEGKKIHIVNLSTEQCLQTLSLPQDCLEVGAISWKPDSSGFVCHIRTSKWVNGQPFTIGEGYILFAEEPEFHWRNLVGNITDLYGELALSREAWCSNDCFVFCDRGIIKTYDLSDKTTKTLTAGYNPVGLPPQKYLFSTNHGYWSVFSCGSIEGGAATRLVDETGIAVIRKPVISPDGNFIVFVNDRLGSNSFAMGIDYSLAIYDLRQNKYAEIRQLVPCSGFYWFGLDFTGPADGPIIKLVSNAVWVYPLDMDKWWAMMSKKAR